MSGSRQPGRGRVSEKLKILAHVLEDDGIFPNSSLPVLLYRAAVTLEGDKPQLFEKLFDDNGWRGSWRNSIFKYHHYHSTSHEVLGVFSGSAKVQLGGESGVVHEVQAGDVLVLPAGVAHKNLGSSKDFGVVGAYPDGMSWDMNYGKPEERPRADENIARVPRPKADPVYGRHGPLLEKWNSD